MDIARDLSKSIVATNGKLKKLVLLVLVFHCGAALAVHYKQNIALHVTTKGQYQSAARAAICFKSSDLFDGTHCGNSKNSYSQGPKNWRLFPRTDLDDYSNTNRLSKPDPHCQALMSHYTRTPKENGQLDIYVEVEHKHTYDDAGNQLLDINYFRHCYFQWTKK